MTIAWTLWLAAIAVSFGLIECYAMRRSQWTFSQYVVEFTARWRLLPFVAGAFAGVLAGHFWWPYCP
jgi:hypothetical protein